MSKKMTAKCADCEQRAVQLADEEKALDALKLRVGHTDPYVAWQLLSEKAEHAAKILIPGLFLCVIVIGRAFREQFPHWLMNQPFDDFFFPIILPLCALACLGGAFVISLDVAYWAIIWIKLKMK